MRVEFKHADGSPTPASATPPLRGVGARLIAELQALAGGRGELVEHRQRPWASVTFSGARHELAWRFDGAEAVAAGERMIADVEQHEFAIPRQLVADVAVVAVDHRLLPQPSLAVRLEVLLLEDG
jgi:hypothetical protein